MPMGVPIGGSGAGGAVLGSGSGGGTYTAQGLPAFPGGAMPGSNNLGFGGTGNTTAPGMPGYTPRNPYSSDPMTRLLQEQLGMLGMDEARAGYSLQNQIQLANQLAGFNQNALQGQYGFDQRMLWEGQHRDVTLNRLHEQQSYANDVARYGLDMANQFRMDRLAGDQFGNRLDTLGAALTQLGRERQTGYTNANQRLDIADDRFGLARNENRFAFDTSNRRAASDATARGGGLSAGFRDTKTELAQQLGLSDRGAQINYDGSVADYDASIRGLEDQYQAGRNQYDAGIRDARLSLDSQTGDNAYNRDVLGNRQQQREIDNRNQNAMLDSIARDYGTRRENLEFTLRNGIDRLGIDLQSTLSQLSSDFASDNAARRAQAQTLANQLIQMGQAGGAQATPTRPNTALPGPPPGTMSQVGSRIRDWLGIPNGPGVRTTRSVNMTEQERRDSAQRIADHAPGTFSTAPGWWEEEQRRRGQQGLSGSW